MGFLEFIGSLIFSILAGIYAFLKLIIGYLYELTHKKEIEVSNKNDRRQSNYVYDLEIENKLLKKKVEELQSYQFEIKYLVSKGYKFLNFEEFLKDKESTEVINVFFVYKIRESFINDATIQIVAYVTGSLKKFVDEDYTNELDNSVKIFYINSIISNNNKLLVDNIFTLEDYKRKGIASTGLNYLKELAKLNGIIKIHGEMTYKRDYEDREYLRKFYAKNGFEIINNEGKNENDLFYLNFEQKPSW